MNKVEIKGYMDNSAAYYKLLNYCLELLSKRRYTVKGIRDKIFKKIKKFKLEVVDAEKMMDTVISRLEELKYLDDEQFVRDFVSDRIKFRPRGRYMLIQELYKKGIKKEIIDSAMDNIELDEEKIAGELLSRKAKRWEKFEKSEAKNKAFRFLASRGFELNAIYKALDSHYSTIVKHP